MNGKLIALGLTALMAEADEDLCKNTYLVKLVELIAYKQRKYSPHASDQVSYFVEMATEAMIASDDNPTAKCHTNHPDTVRMIANIVERIINDRYSKIRAEYEDIILKICLESHNQYTEGLITCRELLHSAVVNAAENNFDVDLSPEL
jgi:hypothetical protein